LSIREEYDTKFLRVNHGGPIFVEPPHSPAEVRSNRIG
jgi:hypothetical protein